MNKITQLYPKKPTEETSKEILEKPTEEIPEETSEKISKIIAINPNNSIYIIEKEFEKYGGILKGIIPDENLKILNTFIKNENKGLTLYSPSKNELDELDEYVKNTLKPFIETFSQKFIKKDTFYINRVLNDFDIIFNNLEDNYSYNIILKYYIYIIELHYICFAFDETSDIYKESKKTLLQIFNKNTDLNFIENGKIKDVKNLFLDLGKRINAELSTKIHKYGNNNIQEILKKLNLVGNRIGKELGEKLGENLNVEQYHILLEKLYKEDYFNTMYRRITPDDIDSFIKEEMKLLISYVDSKN